MAVSSWSATHKASYKDFTHTWEIEDPQQAMKFGKVKSPPFHVPGVPGQMVMTSKVENGTFCEFHIPSNVTSSSGSVADQEEKTRAVFDFGPLLSEAKDSDIVLECGGREFHGHRVILRVRWVAGY